MPVTLPIPLPPGVLGDASEEAAGATERPSFQALYEAHWSFVWRALRALGVREADLEDETHEVFLVVHRRLPEFEGRAQVTTWLWGIASRVASDWRRRAHVRREEVTDAPPERETARETAPDADLQRARARTTLEWILDTMAPEQRTVFVLFELDGMPADEIAALVETPVNTIYSRLRLARKRFERSLAAVHARGGR
ncbi:MAG: sigma-70 family RNA polymerase sigma factor [Polyangiales bacterium]